MPHAASTLRTLFRSPRIALGASLLVLLALPPLYFAAYFPYTSLIEPGESCQFYATRTLSAHLIGRGFLPLWNPFSCCGSPLAADLPWSALYPPNALYLMLPPVAASNIILFLHYSLAGIFALAYLRSLGASRTGALYGAVVYMFSGFLVAHRPHISFQNAVVWFPLIMLCLTRTMREIKWGFVALGACAVAMQVFSDFQPLPYTAPAVCVVLCFSLFGRGRPSGFPRSLVTIPLIFGLGFLICAVQLLPTIEYVRHSVREHMQYRTFVMYSLHPFLLLLLLFPNAFGTEVSTIFGTGYWGPVYLTEFGSGFCGIAPLVLAAIAVVALRRYRTPVRMHAVLALVALALVLGKYNPLYRIMYYVPVYNLVKASARNWIVWNLAIAVLSAFGLDAITGRCLDAPAEAVRRAVRRVLRWLVFVLAASAVFLAYFSRFLRAWEYPTPMILLNELSPRLRSFLDGVGLHANAFLFPLLVMGGVSVLGILFLRGYRRTPLVLALFVLTWVDLLSFGSLHFVHEWAGKPQPYSPIPPASVNAIRARGPDPAAYRVCAFRPSFRAPTNSLTGQWNLFHRIPTCSSYGPFIISEYAALTGTDCSGLIPEDTVKNRALLSMLNVKYLLCGQSLGAFIDGLSSPGGAPLYTRLWEDSREILYENPACLPRAWLVSRARSVSGFDEAKGIILDRDARFDPASEALVEARDAIGALGPAGGPATVTRYTPTRIEIACATKDPAILVLSEIYYPGWRAVRDGAPVPIMRVDAVMRGVYIPPGPHTVVVRYAPLSFILGAAGSAAGLASILALGIVAGVRRRRGKRAPSHV